MSIVERNDVHFALKAKTLANGLSLNARRLAGAIINHFNNKTGPGNTNVVRYAKLLGIYRATALQSTAGARFSPR